MAVLKDFEDIRPYYDKGDLSILVLIDFGKAFDCIGYTILPDYFEFSIEIFPGLIGNNWPSQELNEESSTIEWRYTEVPQGSILGPIMFSIFINDMVMCCKNSSIHLYADDVQIYLSRPIGLTENLSFRLNDDLESIYKWS